MKKAKIIERFATLVGMVKAPKLTYLLRHPIKGPKNLLALRGAKSILKSRGAAVTAAAVATAAVATPLAVKALKNDSDEG